MTREDLINNLQRAITIAAESGLGAVGHTAFERTAEGWKPRPGCLTDYCSSGEAVVCATLLCFYFELHGRDREVVLVPENREFTNSVTDLIWPGAWYIFIAATQLLTNKTAWDAIKMLLPGNTFMNKLAARAESDNGIEDKIISLAKFVEADPDNIGVLSTGESIAMALLFGKMEWLPDGYSHPVDAMNRLGDRWLTAVRAVYEKGWE